MPSPEEVLREHPFFKGISDDHLEFLDLLEMDQRLGQLHVIDAVRGLFQIHVALEHARDQVVERRGADVLALALDRRDTSVEIVALEPESHTVALQKSAVVIPGKPSIAGFGGDSG